MKDNIKFNSQIRPSNHPHDFDAHIYFSSEQLDIIKKLHSMLLNEFKNHTVFIGNIIPYPIGPHPYGMLEINFGIEMFQAVVLYLMANRDTLNILIHPIGEDDYIDHTAGAMWLGHEVQLDLSAFK